MIEQELIFLGLLKDSPKHGYEIKKSIEGILSLFAGVDIKSIYYPLRILEKKGFMIKHITKQGRRPQRFVYELTPRGQNRFEELLMKSLLDFKRPQFSLDLSLFFLHYMKPEIARRRLRARILILKNLSKGLQQMIDSMGNKKTPSLTNILEHNLQMVESESRFLSRLIKTI